jgi:hypothetical protein
MEMIYPIFKDAENMENPDYKDKFPTIPFPNKPRRPNSGKEYKRRLEDVLGQNLIPREENADYNHRLD